MANHYVRAGAGGSASGADWTNAYTALPATLTRGDTYYVADGTYAGYTCDDAVSGASIITIKKATAADHGTETGWSSAYGDGQAVFGNFSITTSYYTIDGQTRDESDWFDGAAYGFSIGVNTSQTQISIRNYGAAPNNVQIRYVYVPGWSAALPGTTERIYAIDVDDLDGGTVSTGLVFHRMFVSDSNNVWFMRTTEGALIEYCASDGVASNGANHGEIVNLYYSGNNCTIRYNQWRNAFMGSGGTALVAITYADGCLFYGNVCWNIDTSDGAVGYAGAYSSHNRVYNNTFVDGQGYNNGVAWGSGTDNLVYNNLWIGCTTVNLDGTHNYNGFSDANARGEANAQTNISTSIFVSYAGDDFRLASETNAGTTLSSPYDEDLLGNTRGAGVWDRGAYEYGTALLPGPANPRWRPA